VELLVAHFQQTAVLLVQLFGMVFGNRHGTALFLTDGWHISSD